MFAVLLKVSLALLKTLADNTPPYPPNSALRSYRLTLSSSFMFILKNA
ncbi:hypothetical protein [Helicobacter cetorum]|nr:hypothetical protein [Helicobacter cetorum]